jgi:DNA-binding NtrC family response regulator
MKSSSAVLLQSDSGVVRSLAASLSNSFQVHVAESMADLRDVSASSPVEVVILDMEKVSFGELEDIRRIMPGVRIVCNHRLADEKLWTATLDAGAVDCCPSWDIHNLVNAAVRPGIRPVAA